MSHRTEERKDNIQKIKEIIHNTQENMQLTNDVLEVTMDSDSIKELEVKNERRAETIKALQNELNDEIIGKDKTR